MTPTEAMKLAQVYDAMKLYDTNSGVMHDAQKLSRAYLSLVAKLAPEVLASVAHDALWNPINMNPSAEHRIAQAIRAHCGFEETGR